MPRLLPRQGRLWQQHSPPGCWPRSSNSNSRARWPPAACPCSSGRAFKTFDDLTSLPVATRPETSDLVSAAHSCAETACSSRQSGVLAWQSAWHAPTAAQTAAGTPVTPPPRAPRPPRPLVAPCSALALMRCRPPGAHATPATWQCPAAGRRAGTRMRHRTRSSGSRVWGRPAAPWQPPAQPLRPRASTSAAAAASPGTGR
jgi:hypothetical protein